MSVNNYRKCAKCGKTRSENETVSYHRFPKPGKANITKARAWATYCWPDKEWCSESSLESLYKSNKVLCGRHFSSTQFYDNLRQKLSKFAVPDENIMVNLQENKGNLYTQNEQEPNVNVTTASRSQTQQILGHIDAKPSTSASTSQADALSTTLKDINEKVEDASTSQQRTKKKGGILRELSLKVKI